MGSDRARVSYDEEQQYRSVVMQQGRVTVEADWNEAQQIVNEEVRKDALDFVGANGTPDDGYRFDDKKQPQAPPFDFSVTPGTMYVGGMRAFLAAELVYSNQTDWLDHLNDPDWVDVSALLNNPPTDEFVYLYLREQEVSAVEDSALKDVALGGPDTAQRTRLIQRIVRLSTIATDCATALNTALTKWGGEGLDFDAQTMRLRSRATLKASFLAPVGPPDVCEPQAQGGYLGADNQLIRVQISNFDANTKKGTILWGFDDASFLYRVDVDPKKPQTLTLKSRPVDAYHQPRAQQAVEVLRSAAKLSSGEYVASATGVVLTLPAPYNPDTQTISLPAPLAPEYFDKNQTPGVFLRVWEKEEPFTAGTAVPLVTTGLQVTLQLNSGTAFHIGDYWLIAVRPSTPQQVYPERYLAGFQPPDGPRLWVCPLAVIGWTGQTGTVLEDCRNPFDNLVDLTKRKPGGGCCTVFIKPEDVTPNHTLQSILDKFKNKDQITICLSPGVYSLPGSLVLGPEHSNLTLEGCHEEVTLQAQAGAEKNFLHGLIVLNTADNVTLRGLSFYLPQVRFVEASTTLAGLDVKALKQINGPKIDTLNVGIGVRPLQCANLAVENCTFHFQVPSSNVFEAGIFAGGACRGISLMNNRFLHKKGATNVSEVRIGYLLAPTTIISNLSGTSVLSADAAVLPTLLEDASLYGNSFSGLTAAALIYAETGAVRLEDNTVRDCYAGFWFFSLRTLGFMDEVLSKHPELKQVEFQLDALFRDPLILIGSTIGRAYPLLAGFDATNAGQISVQGVQWLPPTGGNLPDPLARGLVLHSLLSPLEKSALANQTRKGLPLSLVCSENQIEAVIVDSTGQVASGSGFVVWNDDQDTASTLVLSANKIQNNTERPFPTAMILLVTRSGVTGNLILNENPISIKNSLVLVPATAPGAPALLVAVTGNVLRGLPILPNRPISPPINGWEGLNSASML